MKYSEMQYPTRQDMRNEIKRLLDVEFELYQNWQEERQQHDQLKIKYEELEKKYKEK